MKNPACHFHPGATLIEAMLAVAVLAVAVPLVFGAFGASGKSFLASAAETRSTWIISQCMEEIRASRNGSPRHLPASNKGEPSPTQGDAWGLAFSPTGRVIGRATGDQLESGIRTLGDKPVRFLAILETIGAAAPDDTSALLPVRISVQYPASAPAKQRGKIDFHTRIP